MEAVYRLENGKAFLEWRLYFTGDAAERQVRIYVTDREGNLVLECRQQLREEEPLQSVLLQPRLWRGVEEPYLYDVEAILMDESGCCQDRVRGHLSLRSLRNRQSGSLALNGAAWEPRAVRYLLPDKGRAADRCRQMEKDLRMLLALGADCVCLDGWEADREGQNMDWESRDAGHDMVWKGSDNRDVSQDMVWKGLENRNVSQDVVWKSQDDWDVGHDMVWKGQYAEAGLCRFFLRLCDRLGFLAFGKREGGSEYVWIQEADIGARMMPGDAVVLTCGGEIPILRSREKGIAASLEREAGTLRHGESRSAISREREEPVPEGEKGSAALGCRGEEAQIPGRREGAIGSERQAEALLPDGEHPGPHFYRCLAEWGRKPFVHIVPESVRRMKSGNYTALCYSNCDKVALYSDGVLFEFQSGEKEFYFQEIPAKSPCIMLAAEGEGCGESLSVHKSFVRQWENEGIWH